MAFRGNRSKKKKNSGLYYPHTKEDLKIVGWCLNKDIQIAVVPGGGDWKVEIRLNKGKWNQDPGVYEHEEAMKKMYEYYKYYYDKNKR